MPLGTPNIPFHSHIIKEEEQPQEEEEKDTDLIWDNIYQTLSTLGFIFFGAELKTKLANELMALMIYLNYEDETRDLHLYINSPGGSLKNGIAVFDTMQFVSAPVHTICIGEAASIASFILMGGEMNKRLAFPHARIMVHQPSMETYTDDPAQCLVEYQEFTKAREIIIDTYVQRTGQPRSVIIKDLYRNEFMSAEEAQAYGIIDLIANSIRDVN